MGSNALLNIESQHVFQILKVRSKDEDCNRCYCIQ